MKQRVTKQDLNERAALVSRHLGHSFVVHYWNGLCALCEPVEGTKTGLRDVTPYKSYQQLWAYLSGMVDAILILKNK